MYIINYSFLFREFLKDIKNETEEYYEIMKMLLHTFY